MRYENEMRIESAMKEILGTRQIPCWTLQEFKEELKPVLILFHKIESSIRLILWSQYYHDAKTEKRNNRKKKL
jgi:hypothetical protein